MMMDGENMDRSKMMEQMGDSSMMKIHMMCMQMMQGDNMHGNIMENEGMGSENHKQHH